MPVTIPTPKELINWTQRTPFEGVDYLLRFKWNARLERWFLTLYNQDGDLLRGDVPLNTSVPLWLSPSDEMPQGVLVCLDLKGEDKNADLNDLGVRVLLKYYTLEELQE